jgi:peptidoglycan hydrolase-like protein with peptidoglycan-binding domain
VQAHSIKTILVYVSVALVCLLVAHPSAAAQDSEDLRAYWQAYRSQFPFPRQDVVVSRQAANGKRFVLLSEPPPHVLTPKLAADLRLIFSSGYVRHEFFHQSIGVDGWVTDVGIVLDGNLLDDAQFNADLIALFGYLYKTDYKAYFRLFDGKQWLYDLAPKRGYGAPNLEVTAASLNAWLFSESLKFGRLGVEGDFSFSQTISSGSPGVFYSRPSGLVVLLLPRDEDLSGDTYFALLRQFALDTDAVLGAVASPPGQPGLTKDLAIIGRERTTALDDMPPLRVESVITLAATTEPELGQSYERNAPFAGKVLKDWAPIYLSHDLTNTEFGQLLNITDQLLKGWSESNFQQYENFPYPSPDVFPLKNGLLRSLGVDQLTYNWNTTGYGYAVVFDGYEILAFQRTGALPVSYIPEGTQETGGDEQIKLVQKFEEEYWDFFARSRDPYLERVAEYSALYQIFRRYPVKATRMEPLSEGYNERYAPMERAVVDALERIAKLDYSNPELPADARICKFELTDNKKTSDIFSAQNIQKVQAELKYWTTIDGSFPSRLAKAIINPQASMAPSNINLVAISLSEKFSDLIQYFENCSDVRAAMVDSRAAFAGSYMKTPTIVESWGKTKDRFWLFVGGHNLWSETTKVLPDASVLKGRVEIDGNVLRINPEDIGKADALERYFARNKVKFQLEDPAGRADFARRLEDLIGAVPQRVEALSQAIASPPKTALARGLLPEQLSAQTKFIGWRAEAPTPAEMNALRAEAQRTGADIYLSKGDEGYIVFHASGKPPTVYNTPLAVDAQLKAQGLVLETAAQRGQSTGNIVIATSPRIPRGEAEGLRLGAEVRSAAGTAGRGGGGGGGRTFIEFADDGEFGGNRRQFWYQSKDEGLGPKKIQLIAHDEAAAQRVIMRIDANWRNATIEELPISELSGGDRVGYRIVIPFEVAAEPHLIMRAYAYFKQLVSPKQKATFRGLLDDSIVNTQTTDAAENIGDRLIRLREDFMRELGENATLMLRIEQTSGDFFVVERLISARARS